MKTIQKLIIGDKLYTIDETEFEVVQVTHHRQGDSIIHYLINDRIFHYNILESSSKTFFAGSVTSGNYIHYSGLYTTLYEARKERKKELMRKLEERRKKALEAFNELHKFRESHYKELNITHTDREIENLKKQQL